VIYLDNAATSFPKAPGVAEAMLGALTEAGGNPGRSGHALAVAAQGVVNNTRRQLAALLGAPDPSRVVFTANATEALNLALFGLLQPGDRVVTTGLEHNALVRPLAALAHRGVMVDWLAGAPDGTIDLDDLTRALRARPTRLVAMTHASNVAGTILPAREAARQAHDHGALFLLDAAQTAGALPIDVRELEPDLLALPGHKGLLGPPGTGALYVASNVTLTPLRYGGTGIRSEDEQMPEELPERLEAGTLNTVGLAGLGAALRFLSERGVAAVRVHEMALTKRMLAGLRDIPGLRIHGVADPTRQVATVSISLRGWEPIDLAAVLDSSFGIAVRAGLHCAPVAHCTLGTLPGGTVRLSAGCFTTEDDIEQAVSALKQLTTASTAR
jgi:cysteine desulfurase family protein